MSVDADPACITPGRTDGDQLFGEYPRGRQYLVHRLRPYDDGTPRPIEAKQLYLRIPVRVALKMSAVAFHPRAQVSQRFNGERNDSVLSWLHCWWGGKTRRIGTYRTWPNILGGH